MLKYAPHIIFLLLLVSCIDKKNKRTPVAKVHNEVLYFEDINEVFPEQLSNEDSALFVKTYINKWANEQLLLQKASINLEVEQENINELVNQYKQDLLINKYKEAVVKQELDTLVTQDDIALFYKDNKEIFRLNEALLKFRYIYFGNDIINPKEFKSFFKDDNYRSDQKILEQELQLKAHNLNDSIWIKYDDVIKNLNFIKSYSKNTFLRRNNFIEKEDSTGVYLVKVKDVLLRNQIAPMSYALPTIKQMILHKRKLELLRKIEETLIEDAIKNEEYRIY